MTHTLDFLWINKLRMQKKININSVFIVLIHPIQWTIANLVGADQYCALAR